MGSISTMRVVILLEGPGRVVVNHGKKKLHAKTFRCPTSLSQCSSGLALKPKSLRTVQTRWMLYDDGNVVCYAVLQLPQLLTIKARCFTGLDRR